MVAQKEQVMKKLVKLIVLAVIFAALLAGYLVYSSYMKEQEQPDSTEEDTTVEVLNIDKNAISYIEYVYDEETVKLKKTEDTWQWTEDAEFPVDQAYPNDMAAALSKIIAGRVIAEDLENEADFGMDEPNFTVKYSTTGGNDYVYTIGHYNSAAKGYYIKSSAHDKIYFTKDSVVDPFIYYLLDLIMPETLATPKAESITKAELILEGKSSVLTTDSKGADFYTKPYSYFFIGPDGKKVAADGQGAGELMSAIAAVSLGNVEAYKPDAETLEKYGLGEKKLLVLKVDYEEQVETDNSNTSVNVTTPKSYSINIGKYTDEEEKTEYYAMFDGSDILYELNGGGGLFEALELDLVSKLICPVSTDDMVSLKVEIGSKVYFYNIADIKKDEKLTGIFNSITSLIRTGSADKEKGDLVMTVTFDLGDSEMKLTVNEYDGESYAVSFDKLDNLLISKEKADSIIKDLQS